VSRSLLEVNHHPTLFRSYTGFYSTVTTRVPIVPNEGQEAVLYLTLLPVVVIGLRALAFGIWYLAFDSLFASSLVVH
jgi:hypothetical protein